MRFTSEIFLYRKGQVLEAASLNANFALSRFLLERGICGRLSSGIIDGLLLRAVEGSLWLEPGVFKLGECIGCLPERLPVELPAAHSMHRLWLKGSPNEWQLEWLPKDADSEGICVCALQFASRDLLTDSWLFSEGDAKECFKKIDSAGDVHLEYAMAASFGEQSSLLPALQRKLAPLARNGAMRMWLRSGLFLLEIYGLPKWEQALAKLGEELTGIQMKAKPVYEEEENLAID